MTSSRQSEYLECSITICLLFAELNTESRTVEGNHMLMLPNQSFPIISFFDWWDWEMMVSSSIYNEF